MSFAHFLLYLFFFFFFLLLRGPHSGFQAGLLFSTYTAFTISKEPDKTAQNKTPYAIFATMDKTSKKDVTPEEASHALSATQKQHEMFCLGRRNGMFCLTWDVLAGMADRKWDVL